jgi:hypothetical protein
MKAPRATGVQRQKCRQTKQDGKQRLRQSADFSDLQAANLVRQAGFGPRVDLSDRTSESGQRRSAQLNWRNTRRMQIFPQNRTLCIRQQSTKKSAAGVRQPAGSRRLNTGMSMKRELPENWERQADLHYAYQHGVYFVRGDVKAEVEFKEKFARDAEAEAEYRRGVAEESAKQMRTLDARH